MKKLVEYIKLIRVKHYIKNFLVFFPLVFSGNLLKIDLLTKAILAFIAFSFVASIVYIINDLKDIEKDRLHETKKNRPLAKGSVTKKEAYILMIVLSILITIILYLLKSFSCFICLLIYLVLNIGYSLKLKNIPIIDIAILTSGFLIRVIYGGCCINVTVSSWLYLTVMSMAFYLSLGKRRNEFIKSNKKTREVLKYYTKEFLDNFMYLSLSLTIVFYSLWTTSNTFCKYNQLLIWTVPLIILICMKYSMIIEGDSDGDPVEVVLKDKILLLLASCYLIIMICLFYL